MHHLFRVLRTCRYLPAEAVRPEEAEGAVVGRHCLLVERDEENDDLAHNLQRELQCTP